jgi:hypothetical protein
MVAVNIEGADKLALVGKAVRLMGSDRTVIKNLTKRIKSLGTPVKAELKASALASLPHRGGLNLWVASSRVVVSVRRGASTAGVDISEGRNSKTGKRSDLRALNKGKLRHPVHGNRRKWTLQSIEPGFFDDVIDGPVGEQFQAEVIGAIDDTIAEVLRGF